MGFSISEGSLGSEFDSGTTSDTASVGSKVSRMMVTPTTNDSGALIQVNDSDLFDGSASAAMLLNTGENLISGTVTARDGVTQKRYTVLVMPI